MSSPTPSPAGSAASTRARRVALGALLERFGPLLALLLLIAGTAIVEAIKLPADDRAFLTLRNFANILGQWSYVGIVALGMTFVILLGGIDLSVGAMVALAAGAAVYAMNAVAGLAGPDAPGSLDGAAVAIAITVCILGGTLLGMVNGLVVSLGHIAPFIATLGSLAIYRSLILAPAEGSEIRSTVSLFGQLGGTTVPITGSVSLRVGVVLFLALAVAADLVLKRTVFGRRVFAIGDNARAARYAGVPLSRTTIAVYAISGLTCGLAALLNASRLNSVSSSSLGLYYELDAIAAVVIGGTRLQGGYGRIWGTVIGVLILGVVSNMLNMLGVSNFYHGLVKGLIILAAVLVQPRKAIG